MQGMGHLAAVPLERGDGRPNIGHSDRIDRALIRFGAAAKTGIDAGFILVAGGNQPILEAGRFSMNIYV